MEEKFNDKNNDEKNYLEALFFLKKGIYVRLWDKVFMLQKSTLSPTLLPLKQQVQGYFYDNRCPIYWDFDGELKLLKLWWSGRKMLTSSQKCD